MLAVGKRRPWQNIAPRPDTPRSSPGHDRTEEERPLVPFPLQRLESLLSSTVKSGGKLVTGRYGAPGAVQRLAQFEHRCTRGGFVAMEKNNSVAEIAFVERARFLAPCPPVGTPSFPVAKPTAAVRARGGVHWQRGRLRGIPCCVSVLEHASSLG